MAECAFDAHIQDKIDETEEVDRKDDKEKIAKTEEQEVKPKKKKNGAFEKKREKFNSTVHNRTDRGGGIAVDFFMQATGVRPQDLAKNAQSFCIYSKDTDSYLKCTDTKLCSRSIITTDDYSGQTARFALEHAGSDDTYYIKTMQSPGNDKFVAAGYLFLSEKKSGLFKPLRNVMWSPNKTDDPAYKFKFELFTERRRWYRIICDGLYLTTTESQILGNVKAIPFHDDYEGFFELNIPHEPGMEIKLSEEIIDRTGDVFGRYKTKSQVLINDGDTAAFMKVFITVGLDGNLTVNTTGASDKKKCRLLKTHDIFVKPHTKRVVSVMVDTTGGVNEQELIIDVKEKHFIGYRDEAQPPGNMTISYDA